MDSCNSLLDDAELIYLYDGTLEGMLSAVFTAYSRHEDPANIVVADDLQESLLCSYVPLKTDIRCATRVQKGIMKKLDITAYEDIKRVFLSDSAQKGGILLRYIRYAMKEGRWAYTHLSEPAVADFLELLKQVNNEVRFEKQFIRFARLVNGVFFSHIKPKASVVPLITDHFARRLNVQPFIIYDSVHSLASIFDTKRWWLVDAREVSFLENSVEEDEFQALWQTFFDTIAIKERTNPVCQRNFMPKRFWGTMCEHTPPELRKKRPETMTPTAAARLAAAHAKLLEEPSE